MLNIFSCTCWAFTYFQRRYVYSDSLPIFKLEFQAFLLLSYMSSVCILDINPSSDIQFTSIFSHSIGCLFTLLMVSLAVQKLFTLLQSHLLIFYFVAVLQVLSPKKSLLRPISRTFTHSYVLFQEFHSFQVYIQVFNLFQANVCDQCTI